MNNVINLFGNSPRLSNNMFKKPEYDECKVLALGDALTKRKIEKQMVNDSNLTPRDIKTLKDIIIPALQIEPSLLRRICHVY